MHACGYQIGSRFAFCVRVQYSTKRASTDCVVLARYAYGLVVYLFNWVKERVQALIQTVGLVMVEDGRLWGYFTVWCQFSRLCT